jgi:hypothetical protein
MKNESLGLTYLPKNRVANLAFLKAQGAFKRTTGGDEVTFSNFKLMKDYLKYKPVATQA